MKKLKLYAVHSVFSTLQGEGFHAGRAAVFVRFAGCNVWNGETKDRQRDSVNSACALHCDTEFRKPDPNMGGGVFYGRQLAQRVAQLWGPNQASMPFVVFTGGEPSLQLDDALVEDFHTVFAEPLLCVETNGSKPLPSGLFWRTLSPKPPMVVVGDQNAYDEIKVLYPLFDPKPWAERFPLAARYVQPVDHRGCGEPDAGACVDFVKNNPSWRVSVQTHKILNIP